MTTHSDGEHVQVTTRAMALNQWPSHQQRCEIGRGGLLTQCLDVGTQRSYGVVCDRHHDEFVAWTKAKNQGGGRW